MGDGPLADVTGSADGRGNWEVTGNGKANISDESK